MKGKIKENSTWIALFLSVIGVLGVLFPEQFSEVGNYIVKYWVHIGIFIIILLLLWSNES